MNNETRSFRPPPSQSANTLPTNSPIKLLITGSNLKSPPSITGIVFFLGFASRQSFYDYEKRDAYSYIIKRARLSIEAYYESMLTREKVNPAGPIFALKNFGWKDVQSIDIVDERKRIASAFPEELKEGFEDAETADDNVENNLPQLNAFN